MTPKHTEPKCPISTGYLGPLLIVKFQGDFLQNLKEYFQFRKFLMPEALQFFVLVWNCWNPIRYVVALHTRQLGLDNVSLIWPTLGKANF